MRIILKPNAEQTARAFQRFRGKAPAAIARAINRSLDSGRTVIVRGTSADLGIKQSYVRDRIRTIPATADRHVGQIKADAKRLPLYAFGARASRGRGVTARMPGGAGRYPHAFIARMPSGHIGVFERKGSRRLPIRELMGPSVWHVAAKHAGAGELRAKEQLVKNLQHELRFALSRAA